MTFRVQGTIGINGSQAKAEARAVAGELRKVAGDSTGMARATREAGEGARRLGAGAADAAQDIRALAAAQQQAAADAVMMERNNGLAAGSVANLTAQFNDIAVMLAAGQNPLQLAMQQGMQITQIFGPGTGAAGAVQALGQGLMSMLSPLNLVTIGGIALGATIFQWAMNSTAEVRTLDDALQDLADATEAYADLNDRAAASTADLREEFGAAAEAARELLREEAELARLRAERATRGVSQSIQSGLGVFLDDSRFATGNRVEMAEIFDLSIWQSEARTAINGVISAFEQLDRAPGLNAQIAAAETLRQRFLAAAEASGGINVREEQALEGINNLILGLQRLKAEQVAVQAAIAEANGRFGGFEAAQAAADARLAEEVAIRQANAAAQEMVATLQAEEVVRNQILIFGRDSELVAQNRLAAERESLAAQLEAQGVASDLAARVLEAWDAAKGFNAEASGMPGFLSAAAGAAAGISSNIWNAVSGMIALKQQEASAARLASLGDDERGSQREGRQSAADFRANQALQIANRRAAQIRISNMGAAGGTGGGARGGRGASAVEEEARAVEDLIEKLEREIALERELDPVKREMIRYREQMSEATAAERAQVEALIAQRERERAASESLRWVGEQAGDSLVDALMGAADAGERLIDTLKRAVLQALILGSGPLGGLFGGGIFGGILGGFGGGGDIAFPSLYSEGGMVYGEGGPTDDKVPARLSPGEFVVKAAATRRHRRLLEAINAQGFATGGMVGGSASAGSAGNIGGSVILNANVDARGAQDPAAVEAAARRGMAKAMEEYRRTQLPMDVRRVLDRPNMTRF